MAERVLPDWIKVGEGEHIVWLDDDHAVTWTFPKGESEANGGILWHRKEAGDWCCGAFFTRAEGNPAGVPIWTLESKEPLTLSPSFLCHCSHHGWIRESKWVSA